MVGPESRAFKVPERWHDPALIEALRARLLDWQRSCGRHELPWQQPATPYRVWISEIMLQQTRVESVIPYFERFIQRFPDPHALAAAPLEAVLEHWAGLGYYARARNMHRAADEIVARWGGAVPSELADLQALPGIGPSTAGAIRSLGHGLPAPILDGNVKRILARLDDIAGWPGQSAVARQLWQLSACLVPPDGDCARFNQGLMDLGARLCLRRAPHCNRCPLAFACLAQQRGRTADVPAPRPPRVRPLRRLRLLLIERDDAVLLEQRPAAGIWGGLWSLPECALSDDPCQWVFQRFGWPVERGRELAVRRHALTHFELELHPLFLHSLERVDEPLRIAEPGAALPLRWYRPSNESSPGLPAPIARLLEECQEGRVAAFNISDYPSDLEQ
ncbi:A/G-specific adenine glycosylase [Halorhodospira abdelmalekii]|uniref:A/G-specific adenine glycosylase n=1 Tax=Halorhodospira abdelmalekii TaxID=421629 RepID=UPI00190402C1|nr:A/G-specific adenine glycosylase [Halorhodospira abdelmalekii]MBK1733760.1 A/G-specific adenine glycosylase [Halorhodospira abdelmalekii]